MLCESVRCPLCGAACLRCETYTGDVVLVDLVEPREIYCLHGLGSDLVTAISQRYARTRHVCGPPELSDPTDDSAKNA